jgi:hypothetical protein
LSQAPSTFQLSTDLAEPVKTASVTMSEMLGNSHFQIPKQPNMQNA